MALQRLNRLVLTRHPAEESDTLHRLLLRTVAKIEGFVEEWEANLALQGPLFGGISLGVGEGSTQETGRSSLPGLTPVSKRASAPQRRTSGESPVRREERREEAAQASASRPKAESPQRSRSKEVKKDKKKKRRSKKPSRDRDRDRARRKKKEDVEEEPPRVVKEEETKEEEADFGDETEESASREPKKSPLKSHHGDSPRAERREDKVPKSPSRSPPGFRREPGPEEDEREPLARKTDKPKKDKGYNHYIRGQEFRDKYGYNRGRGRGTTYYAPRW